MRSSIEYCQALAALLRSPEHLRQLELKDWDSLIRVCRRGNLLAKLAEGAHSTGLIQELCGPVACSLEAALTLSRRQERAVHWEIACLQEALAAIDIPLVLLKGAAYLAQGIPEARGRLYSDIDLLIPASRISDVESELIKFGWATTHFDAYDQRYYRQWMHELPPMKHLQRGTVVDVHHRILPRTSRYAPEPDLMLSEAVPSMFNERVLTLSPVDMLLHSATHLFHEGDLANGFRDLLDIDALLRRVISEHGGGEQLWLRAHALNLDEPLSLALRYANRLLGTPVEPPATDTPSRRRPLLDWMYLRALHPHHPLLDSRTADAARLGLYIRSHWLRMPPLLLFQHLARKAYSRTKGNEKVRPDANLAN